MSDTHAQPGQRIPLSTQTQDALRAMFRAAGGVTYGSPKGEMAAILELKLFQLLAGFIAQADAAREQRPALLMGQREVALELALAKLVAAVCPGLESGDLLADAHAATCAMASAEPAAYFAIDDEPAGDGSARYMHISSEHKADPDVFPMYRRAPTAAELLAADLAGGKGTADAKGSPDAADAGAGAGSASKAAGKGAAATKAAAK